MLRVAVTGNIASGKSQVEKFLEELGFAVYDTDKTAHEILEGLTDFYGYDVFTDGKIDRKKLGNLVFNDSELKKNLERYVHPRVKARIMEIFENHKNDKCVFISVPLLYETGFESLFDKVLFVAVDGKIQLKRLMERNDLSEADAVKRINSQQPQEEKINKADEVIYNNSSISDLKMQLEDSIKRLGVL